MNYQELKGHAYYASRNGDVGGFVKWKSEVDEKNRAILADRQTFLDSRPGIDVGDFVIGTENDGKMLRVAHNWGDDIQLTDGIYGASFYLGQDFVSFSGGLQPGIPIGRFRATEQKQLGSVWFFSENFPEAHNGWHAEAWFRVWILE